MLTVRFGRRQAEEVYGRKMYLPTPEDVVIVKLDWYKQSESERHLDDAVGVWQVQSGKLDEEYVERWCKKQSTMTVLQEVRSRAG